MDRKDESKAGSLFTKIINNTLPFHVIWNKRLKRLIWKEEMNDTTIYYNVYDSCRIPFVCDRMCTQRNVCIEVTKELQKKEWKSCRNKTATFLSFVYEAFLLFKCTPH